MKEPSPHNIHSTLREPKFEELFHLYFSKVKYFAMKLLKSEEDAEDTAQDIFLKLWNNPSLWEDNHREIDSYLYTMTKNRVIDLLRERYAQADYVAHEYREEDFREAQQPDSPLENLYCKEISLMVQLSLEQMPEKRRHIFEMSRINGLSNREIAQQLDLSVRTIEHQIYLVLSELKKIFFYVIFFFFLK